jgi:hypothetical protein
MKSNSSLQKRLPHNVLEIICEILTEAIIRETLASKNLQKVKETLDFGAKRSEASGNVEEQMRVLHEQ